MIGRLSPPLCPACGRPVEPRFAVPVGTDWYHGAHLRGQDVGRDVPPAKK